MPIEKGVDWGSPGRLPADAPRASGDRDLARLVEEGTTIAGLQAGDLARTLGIGSGGPRRDQSLLLPVDIIDVTLDDFRHVVCVAHTVIGALHRSGEVVAIMNSAFIGALNIAPRAHPGDGVVDVVSMKLAFADRLKARRRMAAGNHVPHPGISIERRRSGTLEFRRPRSIRVDGRRLARARRVEYAVRSATLIVGV